MNIFSGARRSYRFGALGLRRSLDQALKAEVEICSKGGFVSLASQSPSNSVIVHITSILLCVLPLFLQFQMVLVLTTASDNMESGNVQSNLTVNGKLSD